MTKKCSAPHSSFPFAFAELGKKLYVIKAFIRRFVRPLEVAPDETQPCINRLSIRRLLQFIDTRILSNSF